MTDELYAATAKWKPREMVVVTAPSEWVRFYFDRGPIGEHARWWLSPERPKYHRLAVMGTDQLVPGPWPFGLKVPAMVRMNFVAVDPVSELGGLLLTGWALLSILRHLPR